MKHLMNKEIYMTGIGNTARRNKDKITTATVVKVARVFATILIGDYRSENKFRINERNGVIYLDDGHNGGYRVYESLQALEEQQEADAMAKQIHDKLRYLSDYNSLSLKTLLVIDAALRNDPKYNEDRKNKEESNET